MKDVNINGKENPQKVSAFTLQKKYALVFGTEGQKSRERWWGKENLLKFSFLSITRFLDLLGLI